MLDKRTDFSKYLVHLTKDSDEHKAIHNLISILEANQIYAGNYHCLFEPLISDKFPNRLAAYFKTVCFTEIPLDQIQNLVANIEYRKIKLKPYGLVFLRDYLLKKGANPAIYINAKGTNLKKYLLENFRKQFKDITSYEDLRDIKFYKEIATHYSLINTIDNHHDFSWEREWRLHRHLRFNDKDLVAIICEDQEKFIKICCDNFTSERFNLINKIPIISPFWNYERVIEEFSKKLSCV